MASMAAIETLEDPSFGPELVPAEAQPAPEMYGTGSERGSDCLDRIAIGIYERAVRLHQREHAALGFRAAAAGLSGAGGSGRHSKPGPERGLRDRRARSHGRRHGTGGDWHRFHLRGLFGLLSALFRRPKKRR